MLTQDELRQYNAVKTGMGWFDRSETGKLAISGADRFTWLQGMVSNDTKEMANPRVYTPFRACVLKPTGQLISNLTLVRMDDSRQKRSGWPESLAGKEFVLADLPRENVEKIYELFDRYLITEDVELRNVSAELGCFSVQGTEAARYWEMAPGVSDMNREIVQGLNAMARFVHTMPADHTGSDGFDAYFPVEKTEEFRDLLQTAEIIEVGRAVQEVLRVEAGIPKWGAELDERVIPLEAGLRDTHFSFTKGCYVGQEIIARIDSRGHTNRALTGLIVEGNSLPQPEDKLFTTDAEERETGRITSVIALSPAAGNRPIALGYVRHEHREPGTTLKTENDVTLRVTALPFPPLGVFA